MLFQIAADTLAVIHLGFIAFVGLGAILALKWRWILFLQIPTAIWGALISIQGWICPLTPWEQQLRQASGQKGYTGSFIQHYLIPITYPEALTREIQITIGTLVVAINLAIYAWILIQTIRRKKEN